MTLLTMRLISTKKLDHSLLGGLDKLQKLEEGDGHLDSVFLVNCKVENWPLATVP